MYRAPGYAGRVVLAPRRIVGGEVGEGLCACGWQHSAQLLIEAGLAPFGEPRAHRCGWYTRLLHQHRTAGERGERGEHVDHELCRGAVGRITKPRLKHRVHVEQQEIELAWYRGRRRLVVDVERLGGGERQCGRLRAHLRDEREQGGWLDAV